MLKIQILVMIVLGSALVGCTNTQFTAAGTTTSTGVVSTDTTTTTVTPTPTPTTVASTCTSASSQYVDLNIVSVAELSNYAQKYLYSPTNIKLYVGLQDISGGRYAGTVQISYLDSGVGHAGNFTAGAGVNISIISLEDNGVFEAEYNRWFNNGVNFSGFFQDGYGAIVVVIRDTDSQGCSSGAVYYKNFAATTAPQSPYRSCWFIRTGPYDCRSTTTILKASLEPYDGYTMLGTFSGLSKAAAFR